MQAGWGTGGGCQGARQGAHLGQEGSDEHEEDIVDEQHQQQQRAGLWTDVLRGRQAWDPDMPLCPRLPHKAQAIPTGKKPF